MNGFESALSLLARAHDLLTAPAGYGVAIWVLAIIFAWSGIAKLRRPTLAAMAMMDFGILHRIRPRLGSALGAVELSLALFLISGTLPMLFLPVTAGLLWFFVLLIARSLWSGQDFACFCFGEADSKLSSSTLVRTAALAVLASVLAVAPVQAGTYADFSETYVLQAVWAAAFVGAILLSSQIPRLLRWNKDPYDIGDTEVNQ